MWNDENNQQHHKSKKADELANLEQMIQKQEYENEALQRKLSNYRQEFRTGEKFFTFLNRLIRKVIRFPRTFLAYAFGRRNIKQLYSRTYKRKNAENKLKPYKYRLYNLGFIQKTLDDLHLLLEETNDRYLKQAIAWELALWHANQYTEDDAYACLYYLQITADREKDLEQLRKIAILKAESYEQIQQLEQGKQVIQKALNIQTHPDLYFAAANLEENIDKRVEWINKALDHYGIHPITFANRQTEPTYDDLRTVSVKKSINNGPKVSVILPAYNYEKGIQIAIESILTQTWKNLELLVVDDCSTDETVNVVKDYKRKDPRVKLFSTPVNSGPYVARNIGLQEATGDYVTINDADDWSHAEKIEIQVKHLINNPSIIANTSEHARLTEDLKFYRRGTPGKYIFSNMSSLMFQRKPVLEKVGFWDSVRFAADGEFKRRLVKTFGKSNIIDLKTGPLSLPRQSANSLTGSSAFGYFGYFMGARKEYVESFEFYHAHANTLYYSYPQDKRPFPVPEPMKPNRETKPSHCRHVEVVIASDFRMETDLHKVTINEINVHKKLQIKTGIMQLSCYNSDGKKELQTELREIINGRDVQMIVYGENISCDVLVIKNPETLQEKQTYIPHVNPKTVAIVIDQLPAKGRYNFRDCAKQVRDYFGKQGKWFAYNQDIRESLLKDYKRELRFIDFSQETWTEEGASNNEQYIKRLDDWLVQDNPYLN